ncbi:MAG: PIN domain-containing protein [Candidatus Promineifilaceae bacterium]|nr:PIN domain-containing protein [Candidatus Promineifilaceae bacterium]
MRFNPNFLVRIVGAIVGGALMAVLGNSLALNLGFSPDTFTIISGILGTILGFVFAPSLTVRPMHSIRKSLAVMSPERLVALIIGILLGLVAAALFSLPLSLLPSPFREILPLISALVLVYLSVVLLLMRHKDLQNAFFNPRPLPQEKRDDITEKNVILLDTSVIIDGRITDISKTGFIRATLLVPNFILLELQHVADSADSLRRNRGRRGLEVLRILQDDTSIPIRFTDMDISDVREADSKLIALARELSCPIMTNDYNLNRVAELQGITVLNINELANAVKALYLPGETLEVKIIQDGKEYGQGVGYLEDGTMVVIEDGRTYMNKVQDVTVTKVLQTTAGRMIFARI